MARVLCSAARAIAALGAGFWYIAEQITLGGRSELRKIAPRLFVIVERGLNPNTVAYRSDQYGWIVTDPGVQALSRGKNRVLQRLLRTGRCPRTIGAILLTHTHPDHYGNLPAFLQHSRPDCRIYVPWSGWQNACNPEIFLRRQSALAHSGRGTFPINRLLRAFTWAYPLYMRTVYGNGLNRLKKLSIAGSTYPLRARQIADAPYFISVIPLPGHAPDEVMICVEQLITGDLVAIVGDIIPPQASSPRNLLPPLYLPECSPLDALASLRRLREFHPTVLIPTHTPPVHGSATVDTLLIGLIERTENLIAEIRSLWIQHPDWSASAIGQAAFAAFGIRRCRALGETEMGSWSAALYRTDPELKHLRESP